MTIITSYFREKVPEGVEKLLDPATSDPVADQKVYDRINADFSALCIFGRRRLAIVFEVRQRRNKTINFVIKFLAERFDRSTSTIYRWLQWLKFNGMVERIVDAGQKITRWLWEYFEGEKAAHPKSSSRNAPRRLPSNKTELERRADPAPQVAAPDEPSLSPDQMKAAFAESLAAGAPNPRSLAPWEIEALKKSALAELAKHKEKDAKESAEAPMTTPFHPRE